MKQIDYYFKEPIATTLEERRGTMRRRWKITYDCFNAHASGDKVVCIKGHSLRGNLSDSLPLLSVLRGASAAICKKCQDYDD